MRLFSAIFHLFMTIPLCVTGRKWCPKQVENLPHFTALTAANWPVGRWHNVDEPPSPRLSGSNGFSGSDGIIEPNVPTSSLDSTGSLDRMGSLDPKGYSDPKDSLDSKGSSEPTGSLYPTGSLNPKWDGLIGPNKFSSPRWIQWYNWNN